MSVEESLKCLSLDYLNLLVNSQTFSDVTFSVEGRLVHAHRCVLVARSHFFRKLFCGGGAAIDSPQLRSSPFSWRCGGGGGGASPAAAGGRGSLPMVIPVDYVGYEVFMLMLQFLYSGHALLVPQKHEQRPDCNERSCWHTHCSSAINLALETLSAARLFGVEQLVVLAEKQLASMVEKASIEDVMKVLSASHKQDLHQLWTTCSHLVAKSGLQQAILSRHLPPDIVAKIEQLRMGTSLTRAHTFPFAIHHHHTIDVEIEEQQKLRRMRRALDASDVELVRLMVMGEGLNLDNALALHYAVERCSREVVKALLELGAADVNHPAGPAGKTPLHLAAEMVCPDMVSVLLDHHADPSARTFDGVTPLDILRNLTSEFLFRGAVPGLTHIEPNKLRLCLELVQSAMVVLSREETVTGAGGDHHTFCGDHGAGLHSHSSTTAHRNGGGAGGHGSGTVTRPLYLDLGMAAGYQIGCQISNENDENDVVASRSHGCGVISPPSIFSPRDFP